MRARSRPLLIGGVLAWIATAHATGAQRLDDSASTIEQPHPRMEWLPPRPGAPADTLTTQFWVNVRIDVRPWVNRQARIYMVVPPDAAAPLELSWSTQGRLLPGRMTSGERALVFVGPIDSPVLQDRLNVQVRARADWMGDSRRLAVHFEYEPN